MTAFTRCVFVHLAALTASGCGLLPVTHTLARSPDGRHTASVYRAFSIDPPDDHLYLSSDGRRETELMALAPDMDWCQTIVWAADSRHVGFLINEQRLAVFDAATGEHTAMLVLVPDTMAWGPIAARDVRFEAGGTRVSFERFERPVARIQGRNGQVDTHTVWRRRGQAIVQPARALGREVLTIPTARLTVRLIDRGTSRPVTSGWIHLAKDERRSISLRARPDSRGLLRLPAFEAGPLATVEAQYQGGPHTVLHDVSIAERPVEIALASR